MPETSPVAAEARLGAVLNGRWKLERLLGVGGTAAVYEARHRNGKQVAVKVLHAALCRDDARVERFLREGHAANAVGHPGIVVVDDDGVDEDGSAFLVMELLDGASLERRLDASGPLPVLEVLRLTDRLLDVLAGAHEAGIVHRDVKPDNLFETRAGDLKVLDFGIARLRDEGATATEGEPSHTATGAILGTPAFMAPEQARGRWELVDARTDLWSVGATMFTLLTGEHVHTGNPNEQLGLAMTAPARPIRSVDPSIPEAAAAVVDRSLDYERDARFPSARAMQAEVRRAYDELGGTDLPPLTTELPSSTPARTADMAPRGPVTREARRDPTNADAPEGEPPRRARRWGTLAAGIAVLGALTVVAVSRTSSDRAEGTGAGPSTGKEQRDPMPSVATAHHHASEEVEAGTDPVSAPARPSPPPNAAESQPAAAPAARGISPEPPSRLDPLDRRR